jgi:parallel beta-helix repeat protein
MFTKLLILAVLLMCAGTAVADMNVLEGESIQAALINASAGDMITVHDGTYNENILIIVPGLTLRGENATIVAKIQSAPAIQISAASVTIEGLTIEGSWWGIYNACVHRAQIVNCTIQNNRIGVNVKDAKLVRIHNNTIHNSTQEGIYATRCWNMTVSHNQVSNSTGMCGIMMYMGGNHTVYENVVHHNIGQYGGIAIYSSYSNMVADNQAYANSVGLYLRFARDTMVWGNILADEGYSYNSHSTMWNLPLSGGPSNMGGLMSGGNYWGSYTGIDSNGDGIGDTPFDIPGCTDQDMCPLVSPKCGDCDFNGHTSANDVIEAYKGAVDPEYHIQYAWVVDVDSNGYISANDVVEIYRRAVDPNYPLNCVLTT